MARIVCSSCGTAIAPANVDLSTQLAKCECGNVFAFGDQVRAPREPTTDARRRDLATPHGWTIESAPGASAGEAGYRAPAGASGDALVLTRRWFRPQAIFLAFFCVAWDSFLVFWYGMALSGAAEGSGASVIMLVFPLAHVAVGVGLTYYTLALFLNRTVVRLEERSASVQHGPLKWRGNQQVSLAGLRSVFVRRDEGTLRQRNQQSWTVLLDTDANAAVPLLSGLPSEQDARFVAAQIADREQVSGP